MEADRAGGRLGDDKGISRIDSCRLAVCQARDSGLDKKGKSIGGEWPKSEWKHSLRLTPIAGQNSHADTEAEIPLGFQLVMEETAASA